MKSKLTAMRNRIRSWLHDWLQRRYQDVIGKEHAVCLLVLDEFDMKMKFELREIAAIALLPEHDDGVDFDMDELDADAGRDQLVTSESVDAAIAFMERVGMIEQVGLHEDVTLYRLTDWGEEIASELDAGWLSSTMRIVSGSSDDSMHKLAVTLIEDHATDQ
jgi:hypothetical protein